MSEHAADSGVPHGVGGVFREVTSGATAAIVLLAQMLILGLIAFAPLGPAAVEAGVRAAFAAAIFGNLTAAILGGPLLPNEIPRASTILVFAAFVARLAGDPTLRSLPNGGVDEILFLAALCLAWSGILQIAFGLLRLGSIARFVPYPVVAGLMTGLAIALILYEVHHIMGSHDDDAAHAGGIQPWTLVLAAATMVIIIVIARGWPKSPSRLIGLAVGSAVYGVVMHFAPHAELGPCLPKLDGTLPLPDALAPLLSAAGLEIAVPRLYEIGVTAAAIAVVGSLDSLLSTVGENEGPLDTMHQPNRLLVALGCGNLVSALFGGVPVAYSSTEALVNERAGGRHAVRSVTTSLVILLLLLYGSPLLQLIPLAALAGVMVLLAMGLVDRWARGIVEQAMRRQYDRELRLNLLLVAVVAGVTIFFGLVPAVVTGLILSMALFISVMNRSLVRSVASGENRASRRVYPPEQASLLRAQGKRIRIMELDGAIFFGTAERLSTAALRGATGASFLILDLRRVTMIDASGALMLERLSKRLREEGTMLLLAHLSETSRLGQALAAAGVFTGKHHPDWFHDADRALEWAERRLLEEAGAAGTKHEIGIEEFALMEGLAPAELGFMKPYLDRQLFPARSVLFHAGEPGERLYLLARGAVSLMAEDAGAAGRRGRIVTLAPGVIFGESAVLKGGSRAMTAVAEESIVVYSLSRMNLEAILAANPDLYRRLLLNLVHHLSGILRMTAGVMREAGDKVD